MRVLGEGSRLDGPQIAVHDGPETEKNTNIFVFLLNQPP